MIVPSASPAPSGNVDSNRDAIPGPGPIAVRPTPVVGAVVQLASETIDTVSPSPSRETIVRFTDAQLPFRVRFAGPVPPRAIGAARRRLNRTAKGAVLGWVFVVVVLVPVRPAWSQNTDTPVQFRPAAVALDGPAYPVSSFVLRFLHKGHRQLPARTVLMELPITLGRATNGFVAPRQGVPPVTITLGEVEHAPVENYYAGAVQTILEHLRDELTRRHLIGVYVEPDPRDIDATGRDLRPADRTRLRILITTAIVSEMRTIASGGRVKPRERIDNPVHEWMLRQSPIQPGRDDPGSRRDLLRRDRLDDYVYYLSRHPGRRVDVALSPSDQAGAVMLDFLITENKPWTIYSQTSNTGTSQTDTIRQRFGLVHNQLTDNDDILLLDFMTSFDAVNAATASYEARVVGTERLRWRVTGGWNEFTAREVGRAADVFKGSSWSLGGELIYNFHQHGNLFLDVLVGARFQHITVDNQVVDVTGEEDFFLPHIGVRLDHRGDWYRASGVVLAEWNSGTVTPLESSELSRLGRLFPDSDFGLLRWDLRGQVFLEPLLNRGAWEDPSTPGSSTLAHELSMSFRGQWSAGNRLVPQFEQVIGGLYSVRGYEQSVLAGDSVLVFSTEYRFHLPRALGIQPVPAELFGEPFRFVPQNVFGRPDWDLIFRAFFDVGRTFISDKLPFEVEQTLMGTGVGIQLQLKQNLDFRVDWGVALRDVPSRNVDSGSSRVYFVLSLAY